MILFQFKLTSEMLTPARGYTIVTNTLRPAGQYDNDTAGTGDIQFTCELDNKDTEFRFSSSDIQVGGDSEPVETITPKYSGKALKGYTAVWYGAKTTALAWGQANLSQFEFIQDSTNMLIWGTLNTSKTQDYDPFGTVAGAFCFDEPFDGI